MFDKHYVGLQLTGFEDNGITRPVSRVTLFIDDENVITAGDDTGLELTAECPHATQAMANAILKSVKGYQYQMYEADAATIDPAAELGDGITAGGIYSVISRLDDDGGYPDIAAPGEPEMEDEYPIAGPLTQAFNRKISDTRAEITKTADSIRLEVSQGDSANKSLIEQTATSIRQEVSSEFGKVRGEITLKVSKDDNNQIVSMLNASADEINIKGNRLVIDSTYFKVSADGKITANSGTIGGWTLTSRNLYSGATIESNLPGSFAMTSNTNGFTRTINSVERSRLMLAIGYNFGIDWSGKIYASSADISGKITATSGSFTGEVNATSGVFNSVTINGSTFSGSLDKATGSVNGITGSIDGVTGSYSGYIDSDGTFKGSLSSAIGSVSSLSGSLSSARLNSCSTNGTNLTIAGGSLTSYSGYATVSSSGIVYINSGYAYHSFNGANLSVPGSLYVEGSKTRVINTADYGKRCLSAYETPMPTFADYGTGQLDESGVCYISIDPVFAETVDRDYLPTVFLTAYGDGQLWVESVDHDLICVKGKPGLNFAWESRYVQGDSYRTRLQPINFADPNFDIPDYHMAAEIDYEQSTPDYEEEEYENYIRYERMITA